MLTTRRLYTISSYIAALLLAIASDGFAQGGEVMRGEYIIQKTSTPTMSAASAPAYQVLSASRTALLVRPGSPSRLQRFTAAASQPTPYDPQLAAAECAVIMQDPAVSTCEPNFVKYNDATFPNDPLFSPYQFFHYSAFAQGPNNGAYDLRSPFGWDFSTGSAQIVVGVIDSGINYGHPDLSPNLWINPGETPNNNQDDDGNGFVDDIIGIDATNLTNDPFDCNGHGSHVAGIIGARGNNNVGIAGMAWNVRIITARNAIDCGPSVSTMAVIRAMDYFYDLKRNRNINVRAINASYSGPSFTQAEYDAIARLATVNIVFVAAAGNGGDDGIGDNLDQTPSYPAAYDLPNIVSVANLDTYNIPSLLNTSSNYGAVTVDLASAGTEILSTVQQGGGDPLFGTPGVQDYDFKTGTSMAAPTVVGAIALLTSQRPFYLSFSRIIDDLLGNTFPLSLLSGKVKSGGMLNMYTLLNSALPTDGCPSDPNKIEPGFCGCGQPENYADPDNDLVPNCADACPSDPQKTQPGTCGCGSSDADGDRDGLPACNDQCPSDPGKGAPGACGCGSADVDLNGNGQLDCVDAGLAAVTPPAPRAALKRGKLIVSLVPSSVPGSTFSVRLERRRVVKKKKRISISTIQSSRPLVKVKPPGTGEILFITYSYVLSGPTVYSSTASPALKVRPKAKRK